MTVHPASAALEKDRTVTRLPARLNTPIPAGSSAVRSGRRSQSGPGHEGGGIIDAGAVVGNKEGWIAFMLAEIDGDLLRTGTAGILEQLSRTPVIVPLKKRDTDSCPPTEGRI